MPGQSGYVSIRALERANGKCTQEHDDLQQEEAHPPTSMMPNFNTRHTVRQVMTWRISRL
jgi:hypothetical protein